MMRLLLATVFGAFTVMSAQSKPSALIPLDWAAPRRWVHVDTVGTARTAEFEKARLDWLGLLNSHRPPLADGRALFWSGDRGAVTTYFTFYPFKQWLDLETRGAMIKATNVAVGEKALRIYDEKSDATLLPPHRSEIWVSEDDFNFSADGSGNIAETNAGVAYLEFQQDRFENYDQMVAVWKIIAEALRRQHYPLTCRTFRSAYGSGDLVRLWLAGSEASLIAAPTLAKCLEQTLGGKTAEKVLLDYQRLFPVSERYTIQRRPELSQMLP